MDEELERQIEAFLNNTVSHEIWTDSKLYNDRKTKLIALLSELCERIIGVDEVPETIAQHMRYPERNELRAEQRQRLDKLMNGEGSAK